MFINSSFFSTISNDTQFTEWSNKLITFQKYVKPETIEEAYMLNQVKKNKIVGGMLWLRQGSAMYNTVIDISGLGFDKIEEDDSQYKIGAMVTLRELESNASLNEYTNGAIKNALKDIIGVQFRNLATIGGSIWGRFGFSDVLTVMLSLDTYVELYNGGTISLEEFSKMKYDNDIITHIIIKKQPIKCVYNAVRIQRTDFPVLTCAASQVDNSVRVVIGARPGTARVYVADADIFKDGLTSDSIAEYAKQLKSIVPTYKNTRGSAKYRSQLVQVLTERSLLELGGLL